MLVVSPASIALPLIPFSAAMPHPSWTLERWRRCEWKQKEKNTNWSIYIRQTLFFTSTMVIWPFKGRLSRCQAMICLGALRDKDETDVNLYWHRTGQMKSLPVRSHPINVNRNLIGSYHFKTTPPHSIESTLSLESTTEFQNEYTL